MAGGLAENPRRRHRLSQTDSLTRIRMPSFDQSPPAETNTQADRTSGRRLPLPGLRFVEFTHMVMGPTCGLVLADLGAEVIKIEPVEGDRTSHLSGAGAGFFPLFDRNKKSIGMNLHTPEGVEIARKQLGRASRRERVCQSVYISLVAEQFKKKTKRH